MMGQPIHGPYGLSEQIKDRFEWSVMPTPKSINTGFRGHNASMEPAVIPEVTRKRGTFDTVTDYYMHWLSDEVQQWIASRKDRPILPTKKKFLSVPEHLTGPPLGREILIKQLLSPDRNQVSYQYFKGWSEWQGAVHREMSKAYNGEVPAKTALAAACKAGDAVLARAEL
jgi:ABC-type glycerol-3-phosphate transport system substrate-binding protein